MYNTSWASPLIILRQAPICVIYIFFQTCTQIPEIHNAVIHVRGYKLIRVIYKFADVKSQYIHT